MVTAKEQALNMIESKRESLWSLSDALWDHPETGFHEDYAAQQYCQMLEQEGFRVERDLAGIATAFSGTYGEGGPVIGFLGEFDALPELSQEAGITEQKAVRKGGAGHGCGHNLLGVGSLGAAIGLKQYLQNSGIPCVNMDLIAGLPEDSREGFRATLDQVLAMDPANITVHTLALKKGSRLMTEGGHLPTAEDVAAMLDYAWTALRGAGYAPYYLYRQKYMSGSFENVGWTRPGFDNLYNICMMEELHTVLALGGGGVTKLVDRSAGRIERISDPKYPYEYINTIDRIIADKEKLADFYAAARR